MALRAPQAPADSEHGPLERDSHFAVPLPHGSSHLPQTWPKLGAGLKPRSSRPVVPLLGSLLSALLLSCGQSPQGSEPLPPIYGAYLGDAIPGLNPALQQSYERGKLLMGHRFSPEEGLGPTFNATACAHCHQMPTVGGSAPRYRDFFLVYLPREDGALLPAGTNGRSPVRNLYGDILQAGPVDPNQQRVF